MSDITSEADLAAVFGIQPPKTRISISKQEALEMLKAEPLRIPAELIERIPENEKEAQP